MNTNIESLNPSTFICSPLGDENISHSIEATLA